MAIGRAPGVRLVVSVENRSAARAGRNEVWDFGLSSLVVDVVIVLSWV